MLRSIGTYAVCATGLFAWAAGCSAVLGIEDLGANPPLGKADSGTGGEDKGGSSGGGATGSGGRSGNGGTSAGGGPAGGADGSVPDGSLPDSSAGGTGVGGAGGGMSTGGTSSGGASGAGGGGAGGAFPDGGVPVTGTVIDYWGHKIKNVVVTIGSSLPVTTDVNGKFTIPGVPATYDVSLVISFPNYQTTDGWVFQGLTRRDPTLQVYDGIEYTSGTTTLTVMGPTLPLSSNQRIGFSFGSPDGLNTTIFDDFYFTSGNSEDVYIYWWGGATTSGTAHALLWTRDPTTGFPTTYSAYDHHALVPSETTTTTLGMNLTTAGSGLPVGNIGGTVTTSASSHENAVYLRPLDGAAIQLIDDASTSSASFLYKVPNITGVGVTFAAVDGTLGYAPVGVAHMDDLAAGQTNLSLTTPTPQRQVGPVDGAPRVDGTTSFSWQGDPGVSLCIFNIIDASSGFVGDHIYVVTKEKSLKIPSFPVSFSIPPNNDVRWSIETHGSYATVDEAAGPKGFIDQFAYHAPEGSRRGTGTYTQSEWRAFTTAP